VGQVPRGCEGSAGPAGGIPSACVLQVVVVFNMMYMEFIVFKRLYNNVDDDNNDGGGDDGSGSGSSIIIVSVVVFIVVVVVLMVNNRIAYNDSKDVVCLLLFCPTFIYFYLSYLRFIWSYTLAFNLIISYLTLPYPSLTISLPLHLD
jgi:hypothetical protein